MRSQVLRILGSQYNYTPSVFEIYLVSVIYTIPEWRVHALSQRGDEAIAIADLIRHVSLHLIRGEILFRHLGNILPWHPDS